MNINELNNLRKRLKREINYLDKKKLQRIDKFISDLNKNEQVLKEEEKKLKRGPKLIVNDEFIGRGKKPIYSVFMADGGEDLYLEKDGEFVCDIAVCKYCKSMPDFYSGRMGYSEYVEIRCSGCDVPGAWLANNLITIVEKWNLENKKD